VWRIFNTANSNIESDNINDIAIDDEQNIWIATDYGICALSPSLNFIPSYVFKEWTVPYQLPSNIVKKIAVDKINNIWAITAQGIVRFNKNFDWAVYNASNTSISLNPATVTGIDFDSDNLKWISTTNGLIRTNEIDWKKYDTSNSLIKSNNVNNIVIQKINNSNTILNYKWVATADSGVSVFTGGEGLYNSGGYITVMQHPLITNSLKIVGIVNNIVVDTLAFYINNTTYPHTKIGNNTWAAEYTGSSKQTINIRFRFWHKDEDTVITKTVGIGALKSVKKDYEIDDDISLSLYHDINDEIWVLTEFLEDNIISIKNIHNSLLNNIHFKTNAIIEYREDEYDNFKPLKDRYVKKSGEYRFLKNNVNLNKNIKINNYPNPFNPNTNINFTIFEDNNLFKLEIFDIKGKKVKTLFQGKLASGSHNFTWNGLNENNKLVSSGVYFINLKTDNDNFVKKIVLLK
jgi:sporulation protein YlmC with PRC-barrel domain